MDLFVEEITELDNTPYLAPSLATFFDENGELDVNGDGEINIVYIGGSLTQDNQVWCPAVTAYLESRFPNKTVNVLNAAIGATDSSMGAIRFARDVLEKMPAPDLVFVEYAVNDAGYGTENDYARRKNGVYIESIIRQCQETENKPAVVLLYFPRGFEPGTNDYDRWKNGVAMKERVAGHYGVKGINVLAYVEALYEAEKAKTPSLTYADFLLNYYNGSDMVHPQAAGYAVFGEAIIAALDAELESFLVNKLPDECYFTEYADKVGMRYEFIAPNDDRLDLYADSDDGFIYYETNPGFPSTSPAHIPSNSLNYPRFTDGVQQAEGFREMEIVLKTRADAIAVYGLYSPSGVKLAVYVDGELAGTIQTGENHTRPYLELIILPENTSGARRTVTITLAEDNTGDLFRFGYIIEGFYQE